MALSLLLSISAPLLAWRRLEAVRSDQNRALALQYSRLNTLFELTRNLGETERKEDIVRSGQPEDHGASSSSSGSWWWIPTGEVLFSQGLGPVPAALEGEALHEVASAHGLIHAMELRDQDHGHGFAYACRARRRQLQRGR